MSDKTLIQKEYVEYGARGQAACRWWKTEKGKSKKVKGKSEEGRRRQKEKGKRSRRTGRAKGKRQK
jgi:hypothetical protein